jgi:hypothetical protein
MPGARRSRVNALVSVATDVFERLYDHAGPFGIAAMLLHADAPSGDDGIEIVVCADDGNADVRIEGLIELSPDAAIVFVTARTGVPQVMPSDVARFDLARCCAVGTPTSVLDWLLVGDGTTVSVAGHDD